ncbi:MAG: ferritin-like domain-containing protein, partial [Microbacterium sp.]
ELLNRGAHAGDVAVKTLAASRDAALETAEQVTRREGAEGVAEVLHSARTAAGVLEPGELPIDGYDDLNVAEAVAEIKELAEPAEVRAIVAYEEAHKNRHGVVSAAQTRLAAIAQEVAGLS